MAKNPKAVPKTETAKVETPAGFQEPVAKGEVKVNPPIPSDKDVIAKAKAEQAEKDKATKEAKAKEKADAKAAKDAEKAEAKKAKDEARAKTKAERDARIAELAASGKAYTGSMLSLADRVKQGAYVKGATGQLHTQDELATALDGVHPTDVISMGIDLLKLEENPYHKLNTGQQSMNLRNRMRGAIKKETLKISDIADYITRNKIQVVTRADNEAKAKAKAERVAEAKAEREAKAAEKAKADAAKPAATTVADKAAT